MPELRREVITANIDGDGICVRAAEIFGQFLVSGPELPPNTISSGDYALWLAPGRSLFVCADAPSGAFVSDVTDGFAVIDLSGPRADEILAMACPLDPASLAPGLCAQSLFAGVKAVLYRHGDVVRLHVERALAPWLLDWLRQAVSSLERERP